MASILKLTDGIAVENDSLRLTFPLSGGAINRYTVFGKLNDKFVSIATVDPISQIDYLTKNGAQVYERIAGAGYEMDRRGADCILRLDWEFQDKDGTKWKARIEFNIPDQGPHFTVSSKLSVNQPANLLAFRGPFLKAGDTTTPRSALFPGLDWVVDGESSSSAHTAPPPFDKRFVPHPLKVTVPVMAVAQNGLTVGLAWDPLQIWDGDRANQSGNRYPSAVFASPDFIGSSGSHLMGLFLPSVPAFVKENNIKAERAFPMPPGREIQLDCRVFVINSDSVVNAVKEHVSFAGLVAPPPKPRDYKLNLKLDIDTYMNRAWSEKHGGWAQNSNTDGKWAFYSEYIALALWRASYFTHDENIKKRMRDCVESAVAAHGNTGGLELAYFRGNIRDEMELAAGPFNKLVKTQQHDGGWSPNQDLSHKQKSLPGFTAENAAKLLHSALVTGNGSHLESGIKALRFLDSFDRPNGLRVWDLHESTPDLLAVSHMISAYLDDHLVTGHPGRLEKAKYWAWAGLPFVYLWSAHNTEIMRYATVPFFGSTLTDKKPWFGIASQWNGLAYARQLFRLNRYDKSFKWSRIARAITLCAMQMQHMDNNGRVMGFIPEAFSIIEHREYYKLSLNPQYLTRNLLHLLGEELEPLCEVVPWQEKRVRVTTSAHLLAIRSTPQQIVMGLNFHRGEKCSLTLAECGKPKEVWFGPKKVEHFDGSVAGYPLAWNYNAERNLTVVRMTFDGPQESLTFKF